MPSRKWFATQVTALSALAVMWATTGHWDQEETIAAIGIATQAGLGYLVPNEAPVAAARKRATRKREAGLTFIEVVIVLLVLAVVALAVLVL